MITCDQEYIRAFHERRLTDAAIDRVKSKESRDDIDEMLLQEWQSLHHRLSIDIIDYDFMTGAMGRKGDWMPTFTGRRFWLHDPRPGDIEIEDIAQGLSRISRFNGWTKGFCGYSVAQHSVIASWLAEPYYKLPTLLHDGPESYVGDVITPLKRILGKLYGNIEDPIMGAIASAYNFLWDEETQREVKRVDEIMLATEVRDLLPFGMIKMVLNQKPGDFHIKVWTQEEARIAFLKEFQGLTRHRGSSCL